MFSTDVPGAIVYTAQDIPLSKGQKETLVAMDVIKITCDQRQFLVKLLEFFSTVFIILLVDIVVISDFFLTEK